MRTLELEVVDWSQSHRAELAELPSDMMVSDLLADLKDAMALPRDTPFHLLYDGVKLAGSSTLEEIGIESGEELTIAPEVSAGG
jgi:hypothetical protein